MKRTIAKSHGRGGRRDGSGRKALKTGKKMHSWMLPAQPVHEIKRYAREFKVSQAVALACIVTEWTQATGRAPARAQARDDGPTFFDSAG